MTLRIALVNHEEVVAHGVAAMFRLSRVPVEVVDANRLTQVPVHLVLHDPFAAVQDPDLGAERMIVDPRFERVVAYTRSFDPAASDTMLRRGYDGYLSTALPRTHLIEALQAIHSGRRVVAPMHPVAVASGSDWPGRAAGLTEREADVLSLISNGLSNKEIAAQLGVSINSIKSYIRSCYQTIGVDSRAKAVLWGVTHGMRAPAVDYTRGIGVPVTVPGDAPVVAVADGSMESLDAG